MDLKLFGTVFLTILVAELGDKTQLATLLYATDSAASRWTVFVAAASALVLTSALAVLAGSVVARLADPRLLQTLAGTGFIGVGIWTLLRNPGGG